MSRTRVGALVAVLALLMTGCAEPMANEAVPVMALDELRDQVVQQAEAAVGVAGLTLPAATRVGPAPCSGTVGDLAGDGRYTVTGNWQVPLPADRQRQTLLRLREDWERDGYQIVEYRELPDGVRTNLVARDPRSRFEISLGSTEPPEAVALTVTSPCVQAPDGKYPG